MSVKTDENVHAYHLLFLASRTRIFIPKYCRHHLKSLNYAPIIFIAK